MLRDGNESASVVDYSPPGVSAAPVSSETHTGQGTMRNIENDPKLADALITVAKATRGGLSRLGDFVAHVFSFGQSDKQQTGEEIQ